MNTLKNKRIKLLCLTLLTLMLTSCSSSEDKEKTPTKIARAQDITVSENDKAYEMKVKSNVDEKDPSYYYSYNEKKEDASAKRTRVDANMNVRSSYEEITTSSLVKQLSKTFRLRCSPCHDDYGNGVIGPSLLDKDGDYIYKMMQEYKEGVKKNPLMKEITSQMDDALIKKLSREIASFNKEIKKLRTK